MKFKFIYIDNFYSGGYKAYPLNSRLSRHLDTLLMVIYEY